MPATLLLADDSVTIQRVIQLTFQNEDIRVIATSDGESAIQRIDAEPPDIVLADVGMPKLDGYAVSSHVKRTPLLEKIPVLLLTGAFEPVDEEKARASGCDGVLVKPFEPQQLVGRVKELLAGARRSERLVEVPARRPAAVPTAVAPATTHAPAPNATELRPAAAAALQPVAVFTPKIAEPQPPLRPVQPPALVPVSSSAPRPFAPAQAPPGPAPVPAREASAGPAPEPPDIEATFQREFDQLDAAFAQLDPEPAAAALDGDTASDFARDLDLFRKSGDPVPVSDRPDNGFGDWDIPDLPPIEDAAPPAPAPVARAVPRPVAPPEMPAAPPPPAAEPPAPQQTVAPSPPAPQAPVIPPVPPIDDEPAPVETPEPPRRVSMASAFAALLAAEQSQPAPAPARSAQMSEATIEEIVRRVLARMTEDTVQRIVHDTAERLIREEIEKIRGQ